jgi:hypothetical protein
MSWIKNIFNKNDLLIHKNESATSHKKTRVLFVSWKVIFLKLFFKIFMCLFAIRKIS